MTELSHPYAIVDFHPAIDEHIPMPRQYAPRDMNVPLRPSTKLKRRVIFPFYAMKVTDSFFLPVGGRTSVTVSACRVTKKNGWRFSVRNWVEKDDAGDDVVGIRVWRVL